MIELKMENGSLNVWCSHCGALLKKTTKELRELAGVDALTEVTAHCDACSAKTTVSVNLGKQEFGV